MSLNSPIEPDAARPESVEPVTLSDRVNAVINPTADPSPDAAAATAAKFVEKTGMPQSRKQNSATFTQPETIGLCRLLAEERRLDERRNIQNLSAAERR